MKLILFLFSFIFFTNSIQWCEEDGYIVKCYEEEFIQHTGYQCQREHFVMNESVIYVTNDYEDPPRIECDKVDLVTYHFKGRFET